MQKFTIQAKIVQQKPAQDNSWPIIPREGIAERPLSEKIDGSLNI